MIILIKKAIKAIDNNFNHDYKSFLFHSLLKPLEI